jgi:hypothetical protein
MSALWDLYREALRTFALREGEQGDALFGPEAAALVDLKDRRLADGTREYLAGLGPDIAKNIPQKPPGGR